MSDELRYGMINYNKNEDTFNIFDRNRTLTYDSKVGFLDLKALILKDKLENDEINKLIDYMKPLMNNATERNIFNTDNYQFYFNTFPTSRGIKIQNDVIKKETIKVNGLKSVSAMSGIMSAIFVIHNYMNPDTTVKSAGLVAAGAINILNRKKYIVQTWLWRSGRSGR